MEIAWEESICLLEFGDDHVISRRGDSTARLSCLFALGRSLSDFRHRNLKHWRLRLWSLGRNSTGPPRVIYSFLLVLSNHEDEGRCTEYMYTA